MASSADDVMKKVMRFKLQLTDATESAMVLKILQKLKDLEITLDILAETGIGKTVNSLRRHEQAGEFAKSLVRGWKRLVPKEATSHTDNGEASESLSIKGKLDDQNCPNTGSLTTEDLNNNCLIFHDKSQNSECKAVSKTGSREADSEKHCKKQKRHEDADENEEKSQQENQKNSQNGVSKKKIQFHEDATQNSLVSTERKKGQDNRESGDGDTLLGIKNPEEAHQKLRSDSRKTSKSSSDSGRFKLEEDSNKKTKSSEEGKETLSEFDRSLGISVCSDRKREKNSKEKAAGPKESGYPNQHKKSKINYKDKEKDSDQNEPSMSFESYLNYDVNVLKRKERPAVKKPPKRIKTGVKEEAAKDDGMKAFKLPVMSVNFRSPKKFKETVMDLMNIPLPNLLPEYEKASSVESFEKKVERETDFFDTSAESAFFTGQRLNRKMQVYSGAKTVFLPTMISLHQQCIRTLQNNINLLYETGGVPFEILEPVLERCTPEQLLRIEECNPIYVGVTDHLWGKHCQRDFKDSKLQEYESWKEMYIRLSEERERKLQRLTKSIVSAHSNKPKGRQVKMAFIHTVAKPPRDVRIQQEIHGTAVPQPHQLRCSVKAQDNRSRPICNEPSRSSSSSSSSGTVNTQDSRKKTRVAPMMVKSLKAFKKQLGRR